MLPMRKSSPQKTAYIAMRRFGLGVTAQGSQFVTPDPIRWLENQIGQQPVPQVLASFPTSAEIAADLHRARKQSADALRKKTQKHYRENFRNEVVAKAKLLAETETPFLERLVSFWSNHFTVSRTKPVVGPIIPAYEREAIRPHIFGKFENLLTSVTSHIAMLSYLDNIVSVGPNSRAGKRRSRSLNENLAREILELHTLGVNGGYAQTDVTEFARALTGWGIGSVGPQVDPGSEGKFVFREVIHEPGTKVVLGKTYQEDGVNEAKKILRDLSTHRSTAEHIAFKLARHFIADDPPKRAVEKLTHTWLETGGNLTEIYTTLIQLEEAWSDTPEKFLNPSELVTASHRALNIREVSRHNFAMPLRLLGQNPFEAPSPQGWPDTERHWLGPESIMHRVEWLRALVNRHRPALSPLEFADRILGPFLTDRTAQMIRRAPSGEAAIALTLISPEFQRR